MSATETTTEVGEASTARGLLDREQLVRLLDRAVTVAGVAERRGTHNHQVPVSRAHHVTLQDRRVVAVPGLYTIRIEGRLGPTALSAFPSLVSALQGGETVLTGLLADRSALYGVIGQIEALGLELIEVRRIGTTPRSPPVTEPRSIGGHG